MAETHIQIGDIAPRIQYSGDGAQTAFPYPFPIFADADMEVYEDSILKTLTTDYTLTGAGNSNGGVVTFITPPALGVTVTLRRNIALQRTSDFQQSGELRASVLNDEFDTLVAALQQVESEQERSLRLDPTDTSPAAILPKAAARASAWLAFDVNGDPIAAVSPGGGYPASAFMATVLDDTTAAGALATLGVSPFAQTVLDDADAASARATLDIPAKNAIINGSLAIWQRGSSFTPAADSQTFTADRWACNRNTNADYTVARQGTVEQYSIRLQRDSATTSVEPIRMRTVLESADCARLMGKSVTLSFDAKVGAEYSAASARLEVDIATGTGVDEGLGSFVTGAWAGYTTQGSNLDSLTTSWVRRSVTVTLPAGHKELGILFYWTPVGTAGADDWVELRNIQLEEGAAATPFEPRPFATEFALCQRYFQRIGFDTAARWYGGRAESTAAAVFNYNLPVTMRTTPSVSLVGAGTASVNDGSVNSNVSTISTSYTAPNNLAIGLNTAATLTVNRSIFISVSAVDTGLHLSAEL